MVAGLFHFRIILMPLIIFKPSDYTVTLALQGAIDSYANSTVLLAKAIGSNGSVNSSNSVFVDSSTNNAAITATGTPVQGTGTFQLLFTYSLRRQICYQMD